MPSPDPIPSSNEADLRQPALAAWTAIASYWDATIGAGGNKYWTRLQEPCLTRLLGTHLARPGCRALDLATGNGLCARWLAARGAAAVVATDGSGAMLKLAARRVAEDCGLGVDGDKIVLRRLDVTEPADFDKLVDDEGSQRFDVVLANMALMDVATLEPLAVALTRLLGPDGVFVATVLHPVFFTSGASRNIDLRFDPATGELGVVRAKVVRDYLFVPPAKGVAFVDQPERQLYFHRPIHELLGVFFRAGLVLDALEEPAFTAADHEARLESSANYTQLPALLAFRMRLA
ncbi:S-adenosyl-L-methionine-dependent methyltransferase [Lasiosphaeria miniovina]|uniref:S-adenosyl-L-methionine-dependent methyltransferase n=1 Tax=Lasiosphaeria miniovina TaxID=1954250 RepID=A0AA40BF31_9PEZI|nr:S-adenosyl-L-methionine-dependent methyltransferase [Lasiosphaeria miniovina]KAK0733078.1 S-adenosyl-L-methionine-dependent methyltransferase [Lasiosphaeria miniovina]